MGVHKRRDAGVTYFIKDEHEHVKIGWARNSQYNLVQRLTALQTGNSDELTVLCVVDDISESDLHKKFGHLHIRGEWFNLTHEIKKFCQPYIDGTDLPYEIIPRNKQETLKRWKHVGHREYVENTKASQKPKRLSEIKLTKKGQKELDIYQAKIGASDA